MSAHSHITLPAFCSFCKHLIIAEKHIPNAINIPNENIGTDEISALPDKDQLIMVYCRSGRRSKEAAEKLVKLGYANIVEFGGIIDWKGETVSGE